MFNDDNDVVLSLFPIAHGFRFGVVVVKLSRSFLSEVVAETETYVNLDNQQMGIRMPPAGKRLSQLCISNSLSRPTVAKLCIKVNRKPNPCVLMAWVALVIDWRFYSPARSLPVLTAEVCGGK